MKYIVVMILCLVLVSPAFAKEVGIINNPDGSVGIVIPAEGYTFDDCPPVDEIISWGTNLLDIPSN